MPARSRRRRPAAPQPDSEPIPLHAMRAVWRDPDDITPGARRTPREITGFRTFCPLRRMAGDPASGIQAWHIMAADKLRELVDMATLGFSTDRPLIYVQQTTLPRWGLNPAAVAQIKATRSVLRVITLFSRYELRLVEAIVLRNMTVRAWSIDSGARQGTVKATLLDILDRLAQHFESEIDDELARGRRLTP